MKPMQWLAVAALITLGATGCVVPDAGGAGARVAKSGKGGASGTKKAKKKGKKAGKKGSSSVKKSSPGSASTKGAKGKGKGKAKSKGKGKKAGAAGAGWYCGKPVDGAHMWCHPSEDNGSETCGSSAGVERVSNSHCKGLPKKYRWK